jgi:hypothetical protein
MSPRDFADNMMALVHGVMKTNLRATPIRPRIHGGPPARHRDARERAPAGRWFCIAPVRNTRPLPCAALSIDSPESIATKKNPFMSLWLSGANRVASQARGQAKAAATKQQSALAGHTARFWTGTWLTPIKSKRRR